MSGATSFVQDGGLTFRDIVADIPHDVPAMFVYGLLALFLGFIWWGSRTRSSGGASDSPSDRITPARRGQEEQHD